MKILYTILFFFVFTKMSLAQTLQLQLVSPRLESTVVNNTKQFIMGKVDKGTIVTVNNETVKVYKTGVFVYTAMLKQGANNFVVKVVNGKQQVLKTVSFDYKPTPPITATKENIIESYTVEPAGNLMLPYGETITIKAKAKPGCKLMLNNGFVLKEKTKGIAGMYEGTYRIKLEDATLPKNWTLKLLQKDVLLVEEKLKQTIEVVDKDEILIGETNMSYTSVYIGLGEDRLGGTKSGFLDSGVKVQVVAKYNKLYKVKLDHITHQYIPVENVDIMPTNVLPRSLSGNVSATGDSAYDYVRVGLQEKLPYLTKAYKNKLILDVYGATNNSNWVMQYPEKLSVVQSVEVNQLHDNKMQIAIPLSTNQIWGYKTFYEGNTLVLAIKKPKPSLRISDLVIAVDAGHGGSNEGAKGIAGKYEKEFTLLVAKEVERLLKAEGTTVLMTRTADVSFENQDRLKWLRKKNPDIAISIHLNSAGDPLRVKGTSTYYKYEAYRGLSAAIYKQMLETGLHGWGNIGNFNFFLNSATEFPTALVETLFISNPDDEENIHDPFFRTLLAQKIVLGIKNWLAEIEKGNNLSKN